MIRLVKSIASLVMAGLFAPLLAQDLSPPTWPVADRVAAESAEAQGWSPSRNRTLVGSSGMIAATVSPIAVEAGRAALRNGGNAADAAVTIALTQVTTQFNSVVSYAGLMTGLYYEARTGKVWSIDAGYNSYRNEDAPQTIPANDLSLLTGIAAKPVTQDWGRQTLVPGFMAGMEAFHRRFGRLPFARLVDPAIWYAEHGVTISPVLATFFQLRATVLARTPEGAAFLHLAGATPPQSGQTVRQPALAETLRSVAADGAAAMYRGAWAEAFVAAVQRDGGKVTMADLSAYQPIWSEPVQLSAFGHQIYALGAPNYAFRQLAAAFQSLAQDPLDPTRPYWQDPNLLARLYQSVSPSPDDRDPHHSNAIAVMDADGNIAVVTHTINTVIWGGTGIVVGGIPIPDPAGFQQSALAAIAPGSRLPNGIVDLLVFDARHRPVLATASIGSSLMLESLRILVSVVGQGQDLAASLAAPPLLINPSAAATDGPTAILPADAFDQTYRAALSQRGVSWVDMPASRVDALRGTVAAIAIDPDSGKRTVADRIGVMSFGAAEDSGSD